MAENETGLDISYAPFIGTDLMIICMIIGAGLLAAAYVFLKQWNKNNDGR